MEHNLASRLSGKYRGNLVYSTSRKVARSHAQVVRLNNLIVKVTFDLEDREYVFRAMLSEQEEGLLMIIQDRVAHDHILSGVSGFIHQKPNIHGGLISKLQSFYFHVRIKEFVGDQIEVYFMGKVEMEFDRVQGERARDFMKLNTVG